LATIAPTERQAPGHSDITHAAGRATISVIMPVYNAERFLPRSLAPLAAALARGEIDELIAVDDGSSDDSAGLAARLGARVISSGGRLGPGGARNVAAQAAKGDILWFVDSDVVVRDDCASRVRDAFDSAATWAVFGSYDDAPAERDFGSQYKNLLHHHHHQKANAEAATFWAGCGAVRRQTFLAMGGFNAERYPWPSVEDIDLGYRIRERGGRIVLDRDMLSKHLKRWGVVELMRVDIFRRAIPWTRLMLERGAVTNDLNVSWIERARAALAGLLVLSLPASALGFAPGWTPLALLIAAAAANAELLVMFTRKRGPLFAAAAIVFHQLYYLYSTAAFLWCWCEHRLAPRHRRYAAIKG
jgi:glycosyltransferase involved in cell wall biosynthesis